MPIKTPVLPADLRLRLHRDAMKLRSERNWGYRRISRVLSAVYGIRVPKGTVANWILGIHHPARRLHRYFEPFASPELSYVVGVVLGDGYTTEDQGRAIVGLTNKDRELLQLFLVLISRILRVQSAGRITAGTSHGVLKATVGSRLLALFLQKPIEELTSFIEPHPADFIRGFFDAEGSANVSISNNRLCVSVSAANTKIELLEYISHLLRDSFAINGRIALEKGPCQLKVHAKMVSFKKTVFSLRIRRTQDVQRFATTIGFSSRRKREMLETALSLIRANGSKVAAQVWL